MRAPLLVLSWKSLANRGLSVGLTVLSIVLSVSLFLGVEKIRTGVRASFDSTISDTDLIVGARGGAINLLLYSVFRLGDPTANIDWDSYRLIATAPGVEWAVPISLGRQPSRLSRGRHDDGIFPPLPLWPQPTAGTCPRRDLRRAPMRPCWVPKWPGGWITSWATRSICPTGSAMSALPSIPTMISRSSAFSPPPARRSTGRSMSRSRASRPSMRAGKPAPRRAGVTPRPR